MLAEHGHLFLRHEAFTPDLEPVSPDKPTRAAPDHLPRVHRADPASPQLLDDRHHAPLRHPHREGAGAWRYPGSRRHTVLRSPRVPAQPHRQLRSAPDGYTLFAGDLAKIGAVEPGARRRRGNAGRTALARWRANIPLTGKAMALAGDVLFVAGTPVAFPEDDLAKAYEGRMGGILWAASAATGEKLAEYQLDAAPVWDSMAVAGHRLYIATQDGRLRCFGEEP